MFRAKIITWFLIASVVSLAATTVQLAMVPSASTGLEPLPVTVASIEPQGSFYLIIVDGYGPLSMARPKRQNS